MRRKTGHIRNLAFSENVLGYWPKLLHTHIQNYVMRSFDKIFIHFWIIQDFRFHPRLLCVLFSAYKSGMLDLTNIIGGWFGSPLKVLQMTKSVGPWMARFGHSGSKRVKTHSTSTPYFTQCEKKFLARKEKGLHAFSRACMRWAKSMRGPCLLFSNSFWTKNCCKWFWSGPSKGIPCRALRSGVIVFWSLSNNGNFSSSWRLIKVVGVSKFWFLPKFFNFTWKIWETASQPLAALKMCLGSIFLVYPPIQFWECPNAYWHAAIWQKI